MTGHHDQKTRLHALFHVQWTTTNPQAISCVMTEPHNWVLDVRLAQEEGRGMQKPYPLPTCPTCPRYRVYIDHPSNALVVILLHTLTLPTSTHLKDPSPHISSPSAPWNIIKLLETQIWDTATVSSNPIPLLLPTLSQP